MGCSNNLIGILNAITALLSIPIIGFGIFLATTWHATDCMKFLQWPVIILGLFVLAVSVAGLYGSCCRVTCLLWLYAVFMLLLVIVLFCFTVFVLVVTSQGAGDAVSGKGFKEFHLGNYSTWLQRQVEKRSVWNKIKKCLADTDTCKNVNTKFSSVAHNDAAELSPIVSGCCKPPTVCGYALVGGDTWSSSGYSTSSYNSDCTKWSSDESQLCYDCDSCKTGVVQTVKRDWRKVSIVNSVILAFLIIVYGLSCCALRSNRRKIYYGHV